MSNDRLSLSVTEATARVREGVNLAAALKVEKVFPPVLIHLIASGEKTGSLPPMLERAAQTLSRDIERRGHGHDRAARTPDDRGDGGGGAVDRDGGVAGRSSRSTSWCNSLGDRVAWIASKPAPTGYRSYAKSPFDAVTVGAGLLAMNDNAVYETWRLPLANRITTTKNTGTNTTANVAVIIPPITPVPMACWLAELAPVAIASGYHPEDKRQGRHDDRTQAQPSRLHRRLQQVMTLVVQALGELDDQDRVLR